MNSGRIALKRYPWLWFKFHWYRYVLRKDIRGFYDRVPIIGDAFLIVGESKKE